MGLTVLIPTTEAYADAVDYKDVALADVNIDESYVERTLALSPITDESVEISSLIQARASRVTLGSYTLSKAQTKSLASSMKNVSGSAQINAIIAIVGPAFGPIAGVATAATILSRNATFKKEVISAASKGKRVKVTITDGIPHTSYSTQVTYKVVN
ncbi:hypothetical protein [Listeria booriae]|nr:hypothetical protein [Listeria booriae]MBC2194855.1 hypothetical protein [Listeria booriae]